MGLVGVVGAGVMGVGVAQALAENGHQVTLVDLSNDILNKARSLLTQNIRMSQMLGGGNAARGSDEIMASIRPSTDYDDLSQAEYVIENVTEKWNLKAQVYRRLDEVCVRECILVANTSAIPITRIGSATRRPDKVIGVHFMNPVPLKHTVELIPAHHTSEVTIERTVALLESMGKEGVRIHDSPGFVSNRVLMPTINEAAYLIYEHVANAADVDKVFVSCFGHPMGPLATADLIGLDTILYSIEVLHDSFNDSKYRPCPLLRQMVDAGLHGRKTGRGFFPYS